MKKKKIIRLKTVKPKRGRASAFNMKLIHQVINDLESGKTEEIAIVGLNKDGSMMRAWSAPNRGGNCFRMLGAIEVLRNDYMNRNIEE